MEFGDLARSRISCHSDTLDNIGVPDPYFASWGEPEKLFGGIFTEIVLLNIEDARKGNLSRSCRRILRIVDRFQFFRLVFGIVVEDDFEWPQHGHNPGCSFVQVFANKVFEQLHLDNRLALGYADMVAECTNGLWGIPAAAKPFDRRQSWIIPTVHQFLFDQLKQHPLAHDGIGQVQASKFDLPWSVRCFSLFDDPIVEWPVIFKFQGAE